MKQTRACVSIARRFEISPRNVASAQAQIPPSRTRAKIFIGFAGVVVRSVPIGGRAHPAHTRTHAGFVPPEVPVVMSAIAASAASAASAARVAAPRAPARRGSGSATTNRAFSKSATAARPSVRAKALSVDPEEGGLTRRDALIALAGAVATPAFLYGATDSEREAAREAGVAAEPVALAGALRAQTVYAGFCIPIIEKNVSVPYETLISLAIRDAGSYDAASGSGGLNGSIRFELDRPENKKFVDAVRQLETAKREIDQKAAQPIGWADLIALAPFATARYQFLRDYCGVTPRYEPRWQYKAGDINIVGCDMEDMLRAPYGHSAEQIEATSWFRQSFAGVGPLTGQRVHMGREDATAADAFTNASSATDTPYPLPGASASEYKAWFRRMRLSLPALVNLAPYVDETCEKTLRADPECVPLFAEIDNKSYAPGYKEKPLIKALREVTLRGPAMRADVNKYVVVDGRSGAALAAIPKINGKTVKNVKTLMDEYHDPFPVWIM